MAITRPKVLNGNSVEQALCYLQQHFDALEEILRAIKDTQVSDSYRRGKWSIPLDATGAGTLQIPVPPGYDYILERITIAAPANGTAQVFVDGTNPSDQVEVIGSTQLYSDAFDNNIFVPSQSSVFIVFAASGVNGTASVNLQIRVIKREAHTHNPHRVMLGDA